MGFIHNLFEFVILVISTLGAIVVIWGVIDAVRAFVLLKYRPGEKNAFSESEEIRQSLGAHLLLGLEIFIAADIISTVISPSWEKVGILAVIVVIRTVLSHFLRIELQHEIHTTK